VSVAFSPSIPSHPIPLRLPLPPFFTCTRSRTVPRMVGLGNLPLTRMTSRSTPSGDARPQVAVSLSLRVSGLVSPQAAAQPGDPGDAASTQAAVWQKKEPSSTQNPNWEQHWASGQAPTNSPHTLSGGTGGKEPTILGASLPSPLHFTVASGVGRLAEQGEPGPE